MKIFAAILVAGILWKATEFVVELVVEHEDPAKVTAYRIDVAAAGAAGEAEAEPEPVPSVLPLLAAADPDAGAQLARACTACHNFEAGGGQGVGPANWGVVGRQIAAVADFAGYSDTLNGLGADGAVWDYEALNHFLLLPRGFAPGTSMGYAGMDDIEDRADLIAWMRQQADEPLALPTEAQIAASLPVSESAAESTEPEADVTESEATTEPEADVGEASILARLAKADVEAGGKAALACTACHSFEAGGRHSLGPANWGVVGRPMGSAEGFGNYSAGMRQMGEDGGVWDYASLDAWLENPRRFIDGTNMTFRGIKDPQDRANVIAWLRLQADEPLALPAAGAGDGEATTEPEESTEPEAEVAEPEADGADAGAEASIVARLANADVEAGGKVALACTACHSFEAGGRHSLGPANWGVVGRPMGSAEGFGNYSAGMRQMGEDGGVWDYASLDAWLENPRRFIDGTNMTFVGIKDPQDRANVIAWLRLQADEPLALPAAGAGDGEATTEPEESTEPEAEVAEPEADGADAGAEASILARLANADVEAGGKVALACTACHSFEAGGRHSLGPANWGVVGRPMGSAEGFGNYSAGMRQMGEDGGVWDYASLDAWLENPRRFIDGTNMTFVGIKDPQDRANVIAWLRLQADEPVPLPGQ